jgi:hypothetical protein
VTEAEYPNFADALGQVAIACSKDLDTPTIDLYFKALKEIPWQLIRHATAEIVKFEERWPSPAKWRHIVDEVSERFTAEEHKQIVGAQQKLLPAPVWDPITQTYVETFHCFDCHDTGWRPECGCPMGKLITALNSPDGTLKNLGHCLDHGGLVKHGHVYAQPMKPCACRATNPVYRENRPLAAKKYGKTRPKKRRADGE